MEFMILIQFLRLLGAIALEGLVSLFHVLVFLVRRRTERERVFALIVRKDSGLATVLALLGAVMLSPLTGCSTYDARMEEAPQKGRWGTHQAYPGTTFDEQMDNLAWSFKAILGMEGAQKSMEEDLEAFGSGTSMQVALDDTGVVLTDPGMQQSLEDDLDAMGAPEPGALMESLKMLGF